MPDNTTASQDRFIESARSSTIVSDLIDIIEELDGKLTDMTKEKDEAQQRIKELELELEANR